MFSLDVDNYKNDNKLCVSRFNKFCCENVAVRCSVVVCHLRGIIAKMFINLDFNIV
jgi:hypothetical protein